MTAKMEIGGESNQPDRDATRFFQQHHLFTGNVVCLIDHSGRHWTWAHGVPQRSGRGLVPGDEIKVDWDSKTWTWEMEDPSDFIAALLGCGLLVTARTAELYQLLDEIVTKIRDHGCVVLGHPFVPGKEHRLLFQVLPPGSVRRPKPREDGVKLPACLPQQTCPEVKTMAVALADGPRLRRWSRVDGELALVHMIDQTSTLKTKLLGTPLLNWLGLPLTATSLESELQRAGLPAVLLLHVCIGLAVEQMYVTVAIDDLISGVGWDPRSRAVREQMRRTIWRWLALFYSTEVIGQRRGTFRDPDTREVIDTLSRDPLLADAGREMPAQLAFDDSVPPLRVTFVAGRWINRFRNDHRVLTYFGDVRKLAAIPAGKPSGQWAQAIGLALQQGWRERASRSQVAHVGDDKAMTIRAPSFTRRNLLDTFPPKVTADEILDGKHPKRAKDYWREAIQLLRQHGLIGHYQELGKVAAERQGWAHDWLDQQLDIRPNAEGKDAMAKIATRAGAARARRPRRRVPAAQ